MSDGDLKSLARTKAEKKESTKAFEPGEREFPWGLEVSLDTGSLKKLGRTVGDFKTGEYVTLTCKAKCTGTRLSNDEGGETSSVDLQIEAMNVETPSSKAAKAHNVVFGDGK
jgi:hypothetical protein